MPESGVLVTGGAGYIGSHTLLRLGAGGERLVTLDNLSTGMRGAVLHGDLVVGDIADQALVTAVLHDYQVDTVLHFAAHSIVAESVTDPLRYYQNNSCGTRSLLECCAAAGVRHFVFSSTAAVYGTPEGGIAWEDSPTTPINPYGWSKLMSEWMLRDLSAASRMRNVILRYFNVAGCDPEGRIGQTTEQATLLTKVACEAAVGRREAVSIYGTDYPTPDGTGIRDYLHVSDLADAHVLALDYLRRNGNSITLNCGYGRGYSVREVIAAVERANQAPLNVREAGRRPGDPAILIAGSKRIREILGWQPACDDLDLIARTSLAWERRLAAHGPSHD